MTGVTVSWTANTSHGLPWHLAILAPSAINILWIYLCTTYYILCTTLHYYEIKEEINLLLNNLNIWVWYLVTFALRQSVFIFSQQQWAASRASQLQQTLHHNSIIYRVPHFYFDISCTLILSRHLCKHEFQFHVEWLRLPNIMYIQYPCTLNVHH